MQIKLPESHVIKQMVAVFVSAVTVGCSTTPKERPSIPVSWSQKIEERGKLPTGKVIAIVPWKSPDSVSRSTGSEITKGLIGAYVVVPLALLAAPAALLVCSMRDDGCNSSNKYGVEPDENGNVFRHVVQLSGSQKEVIKDEFWSFRVGDCVALREEPDMLVPALNNECASESLPSSTAVE